MNLYTHEQIKRKPGEEERRRRGGRGRKKMKTRRRKKKKRTVACAHDLHHLIRLFYPLEISRRYSFTKCKRDKQKYNSTAAHTQSVSSSHLNPTWRGAGSLLLLLEEDRRRKNPRPGVSMELMEKKKHETQ